MKTWVPTRSRQTLPAQLNIAALASSLAGKLPDLCQPRIALAEQAPVLVRQARQEGFVSCLGARHAAHDAAGEIVHRHVLHGLFRGRRELKGFGDLRVRRLSDLALGADDVEEGVDAQ